MNLNPYHHLPHRQRDVQRIADLFNADEAHWRKLEPRRQLRRKILRLTKKQHEALDRLEFAATRPLDDCVGRSQEESKNRWNR